MTDSKQASNNMVKRFTKEDDAMMLAMLGENKAYSEIAALLDCKTTDVIYRSFELKRAGKNLNNINLEE